MTTKLSFALLVCLLIYNIAVAQKVTWGSQFPEGRSVHINQIVGHDAEGLVVMKRKGTFLAASTKGQELQRFDKSLLPATVQKVVITHESSNIVPAFCFKSHGEIYMFGSFENHQLNKKYLFVQKIAGGTLKPEGAIRKVAELSFTKRVATGGFGYTFSRDSTKILIFGKGAMRKNEMETFSFAVFDNQMQPLWEREVTLPYLESKFAVFDYTIDRSGNVFLLGRLYGEGRGIAKDGKPNYKFKILSYNATGADAGDFDVTLGDKFLTEMKIDVSPKKDIICAGFYADKGSSILNGTYYLRVDRASGDVVHARMKEFDMNFITMNFTDKQVKKTVKKAEKGKNAGLYSYDLRDLIPRADGGAVLLAEQFYIVVTTTTDSKGNVRTTNHYHFHDIIAVSIDPEGEIEWATKIPKRQVSSNDGGYYSSFATMTTDEKLYFIYNEHRDNLNKANNQPFRNYSLGDKNGVVAIAAIDEEGNYTRKELFPNTEMNVITRPALCKQVSATELVLYGKRKKSAQFGRVVF